MSDETLQKSIERVSDLADSSHWIWHGGEPLLMGVDFFRRIKEIQDFYRARGKKIRGFNNANPFRFWGCFSLITTTKFKNILFLNLLWHF
jgi:hypothetical protein